MSIKHIAAATAVVTAVGFGAFTSAISLSESGEGPQRLPLRGQIH